MKKWLLALLPIFTYGQHPEYYWQQEVNYKMQIDMDVKKHQFTGKQQLIYTNNSPDTIKQLFYHLYFNAFQPGSMMDERSLDIPDPDKRVGNRISKLKQEEIGYHEIMSLLQDSVKVNYNITETVLQVELSNPIPPGGSTRMDMQFRSQVPVQIRRSGRDNAEGVDYTMTQWYPKLAAYDKDGWHPEPYIAREFYADFGTFDVEITLPGNYMVGGTGVLADPESKWEKGKLIENRSYYNLKDKKASKKTWHFTAENVHDFAWAADPDFIRYTYPGPDNIELNFYYVPGKWKEKWDSLGTYTAQFFELMNENFGQYPYPQFSVIQGGDGGMEYPMCTMLKGSGKLKGLVGVMAHEAAHNWYYGVLASNEFRYPWMDEGFTSYAEEEVLNIIWRENKVNPHLNAFRNHNFLVSKEKEGEFEPLSTPADYFARNRTYGISAYSRGQVFLVQLKYIIGEEAFKETMLTYFEKWKFKHPDPWDFLKVAEDVSNIQLDWYLNFWLNTTKSVDYAIADVETHDKGHMTIELERLGDMPMPVELRIELKNGMHQTIYIPVVSMFGSKKDEDLIELKPWPWTSRNYKVELELAEADIERIIIDPNQFTSDVNRENNEVDIDD